MVIAGDDDASLGFLHAEMRDALCREEAHQATVEKKAESKLRISALVAATTGVVALLSSSTTALSESERLVVGLLFATVAILETVAAFAAHKAYRVGTFRELPDANLLDVSLVRGAREAEIGDSVESATMASEIAATCPIVGAAGHPGHSLLLQQLRYRTIEQQHEMLQFNAETNDRKALWLEWADAFFAKGIWLAGATVATLLWSVLG